MIYFILWVLFLLTVLLAVPIAALIEKRKYQAHVASEAKQEPAWSEEDVQVDDESTAAGASAAEAVEFSEVDGGEDFSAFDEIE